MKKAILVAMGFVMIATVACKKDDDAAPVVTSADLIASTIWRIDTIGFDVDKNAVIDMSVPGGLAACQMDNTLKFSLDSTGVFDEGATKCQSSTPQSIPFTWSLKENDKVINITGNLPGDLKGDINVLTLTDSTFVMSKEVTIALGNKANLIISLQK